MKENKCLKKFLWFKWYKHDYEPYRRVEKTLYNQSFGRRFVRKYKVIEKDKCLKCKHKRDRYIKTVTHTTSYE